MIYALLIFILISVVLFLIARSRGKKIREQATDIEKLEDEHITLITEIDRLHRLQAEFTKIEEETDAKKKKLHSGNSADNVHTATDAMSKLSKNRSNPDPSS